MGEVIAKVMIFLCSISWSEVKKIGCFTRPTVQMSSLKRKFESLE